MRLETTIRLVVIVLLGILAADRQAPAYAGERASETPASLVLTYELQDDLRARHYVWFVDTLGRRFSFSRYCDDPLAVAQERSASPRELQEYLARLARSDGSVGPKQFASLVALSEQLGPPLSRQDVDHLSTLVSASHSVAPVRTRDPGCLDAATIRLRAYWPTSSGSSFVTLWESYCDKIILQNSSPAAKELVQWVFGHAGVWDVFGKTPVLPWKAQAAPPSVLETSREELNDIVRSERPRTTACYETALKTNPRLSGEIDMYWMIDAEGAPQDIKVDSYSSRSLKASSVPDCLRAIIAKWRFRKACPNSRSGYGWNFPPP